MISLVEVAEDCVVFSDLILLGFEEQPSDELVRNFIGRRATLPKDGSPRT